MDTSKANLQETYAKLLNAAENARANAYAPYSNYKVGCALMDEQGRIFAGCNVETIHYLGTHAEASAIAAMVTAGGKTIKALLCITENGGSSCGDCRQRIWEFCNNNKSVDLYFVNAEKINEPMITSIGELLPDAFHFDKS